MKQRALAVCQIVLLCSFALGFPAPASEDSESTRLPDDMRGVGRRATDDLRAGRYNAAAEAYQTIIAKYPDSLYAWSNLGVVRSNQGDFGGAVRAFKHAVALSPGDVLGQINLGMCLFEENHYADAIPPLERAEKLRPENANVHALLARCYQEVGRDDEAREERQIANVQQMGTYE